MSDSFQDTDYSKTSAAEDLTTVMNVAGTEGRSSTVLLSATDAKKSTSMPIMSVKGASKKITGLSPFHQANMTKEIVVLLTPLIYEQFALSNRVAKKLKAQLGIYFKATGIANVSCLGMMAEYSTWVVPESFATNNPSLEQLTVLVLLLLTKLATYSI